MSLIRAEIISIGDEITSGTLLDTNTQWISQQLRGLGVDVAFHTTVGDDLAANIDVFRIATGRADLIIATGGLGPTADDLTRQAIARMAGVELFKDADVLDRIARMYERRGREMPASNEIQAWFPLGAAVINNPEGTAPGIDFCGTHENGSPYRLIAIPGVPAELKQMWSLSVGPAIEKQVGTDFVFHQHTIRCFGTGESQIESMLPDLMQRGRDPQVGITASSATISLRLSTRGKSQRDCLEKMQPTIAIIESQLGDLVYGVNDDELESVVVALLKAASLTIALTDGGLNGSVAEMLARREVAQGVFFGGELVPSNSMGDIRLAAKGIADRKQSSLGLAIGPINRENELVDSGKSFYGVAVAGPVACEFKEIQFIGHSSYRDLKAAKEVLNFLRLYLLKHGNQENR